MPTITKECVYIIMYPRCKEGSTTPARFDMDYYMNVHCPEAEELWKGMGMKKIEVHQVCNTTVGVSHPVHYYSRVYRD